MGTVIAERTEALRTEAPAPTQEPGLGANAAKSLRRHWQLYLLIIPPLLYFILFKYIPMLNAVGHAFFKRTVQLVTYAPYFISVVVLVSILNLVLAPRIGIVNQILGI